MRRITAIALFMLLSAFALRAQNVQTADSVVYRQAAAVDSTLYGKNIMNLMPSRSKGDRADVKVYQSQAIVDALKKQVASNPSRTISGYRVRIFFDNSQSARNSSEATLARFCAGHPGIAAYRSFQSPYFKVTVGDLRTKSEAMELLERIKGEFPSAFIVKENINYPVADRKHSFVADTITVVKRVKK